MTSVARLGLECNRNLAVYDRCFYYVYTSFGTIGTSVSMTPGGPRAVISSRKVYRLSTLNKRMLFSTPTRTDERCLGQGIEESLHMAEQAAWRCGTA